MGCCATKLEEINNEHVFDKNIVNYDASKVNNKHYKSSSDNYSNIGSTHYDKKTIYEEDNISVNKINLLSNINNNIKEDANIKDNNTAKSYKSNNNSNSNNNNKPSHNYSFKDNIQGFNKQKTIKKCSTKLNNFDDALNITDFNKVNDDKNNNPLDKSNYINKNIECQNSNDKNKVNSLDMNLVKKQDDINYFKNELEKRQMLINKKHYEKSQAKIKLDTDFSPIQDRIIFLQNHFIGNDANYATNTSEKKESYNNKFNKEEYNRNNDICDTINLKPVISKKKIKKIENFSN